MNGPYRMRPFRISDQPAARALILTGLAERWGELDPAFNTDLDDIWTHYVQPGGAFWVVTWRGLLVGTGALSMESPGVGRIERVSVHVAHRRQGLGHALTRRLLEAAHERELRKVVVETTETWQDAIRLYRQFDFQPVAYRDGDVHMELAL